MFIFKKFIGIFKKEEEEDTEKKTEHEEESDGRTAIEKSREKVSREKTSKEKKSRRELRLWRRRKRVAERTESEMSPATTTTVGTAISETAISQVSTTPPTESPMKTKSDWDSVAPASQDESADDDEIAQEGRRPALTHSKFQLVQTIVQKEAEAAKKFQEKFKKHGKEEHHTDFSQIRYDRVKNAEKRDKEVKHANGLKTIESEKVSKHHSVEPIHGKASSLHKAPSPKQERSGSRERVKKKATPANGQPAFSTEAPRRDKVHDAMKADKKIAHLDDYFFPNTKILTTSTSELVWDNQTHIIVDVSNPTNETKAVKITCSDQATLVVKPNFFFIEPGYTVNLEVIRHGIIDKAGEVVIFYVKKDPYEWDVARCFEDAAEKDILKMTLASRPKEEKKDATRSGQATNAV